MKTNRTIPGWLMLLALATLNLQPSTALAQGTTAFTYQGQLNDNGSPANGSYDLRFTLYDAVTNGSVIGALTNSAAGVTNGLFAVTLDFGNGVFTGPARWLQLDVRTNGSGAFAPLLPRQPVLPVPYALMAGSASNLLGQLPAQQLSGSVGNGQLASSSVTVNAGAGLSGGGAVTLGGSTTLNNAGVLSVTGNADIIASPSTGGVVLGTTATNANTANRIVRRDAGGNFSATSVTLDGNLNLPATTASVGIVNSGGNRLLHSYGNVNMFAGGNAGNFTLSGFGNVGVGYGVLGSDTSGSGNTANGYLALQFNTSGANNTADGISALRYNTTGSGNTASGHGALNANTTGSYNIALGDIAGYFLTTGNDNIDIGNIGLAGDNATIRIGTQGTQTNTFIAGIYGNNAAGGVPVYVDSAGQLATSSGSPVALLNGTNNFTGTTTFAGAVIVSNATFTAREITAWSVNTAWGVTTAHFGGDTFTGGTFIGDGFYGGYFVGDGSLLTNLNADNLASGSVPDAQLGANVARLDRSAMFTGTVTAGGDLVGARLNVGSGNSLGELLATIAGGQYNTINNGAQWATISGGQMNRAGAQLSVIGGGYNNTNLGNYATIGGGAGNTIKGNGSGATIPGGYNNIADWYRSFAAGSEAQALHSGAFVWADSSGGPFASTGDNQFLIRAGGGVGINKNNPATALDVNGVVTATSFNPTSDRAVKDRFAPVDGLTVLAKVVAMPLETWNFKSDPATRHIGPMAQDFYSAFGVGTDDKHIATVDADGVALAAIQGLNQKVAEKDAELQQLKQTVERLQALVGDLTSKQKEQK